MIRHARKLVCWLVTCVCFFTWCTVPFNQALAQSPAQTKEWEQAAERLERLFNALEEARKEIPRDTFDPQAIVNIVGCDPVKLFEWVRDNTYLVPYRGSLRGHIGVLMDRLGNSLDRAILLHKLLTMTGYEARFVRGSLTKKQAEAVLNNARPIPPGGALPAEEQTEENLYQMISQYADKFGLDPVALQNTSMRMRIVQQHMAEELAQRVEEQTEALLELLGDIPDIREAEWNKAVSALQDHWWLEWKSPSGWIALDPTLPEAKPNKTLTQNESTVASPDDLAQEDLHLLTIRVIIERWRDGGLEEETVFEHALQPSKLFGKTITIRNVPLNWPSDIKWFSEKQPLERLKNISLDQDEWLPVLTVGNEFLWQLSFNWAGKVKQPNRRNTHGMEDSLTSAWGLLSPRQEELDHESYLTAEWIEYEMYLPGRKTDTIRRHFFDEIGFASRNAKILPNFNNISSRHDLEHRLALLGGVRTVIQVSKFSREFLSYIMTEGLNEYQSLLKKNLVNTELRFAPELIEKINTLSLIPGPELALAASRFGWNRNSCNTYFDSFNIISSFSCIRLSSAGELVSFQGLDIIANELAANLHSVADPFRTRLRQGVIDTNIETLIMNTFGHDIVNTGEFFRRDMIRGIRWSRVPDDYFSSCASKSSSINLQTMFTEDFKKGYIVVAPYSKDTLNNDSFHTWWRIDSATGSALGLTELGKGGAYERAILERHISISILIGGSHFLGLMLSKCPPGDYACLLCSAVQGVFTGIGVFGLIHGLMFPLTVDAFLLESFVSFVC